MKSAVLGACALVFTQTASAQIISQTPRPDVPDPEAASVETLTPSARIGSQNNTIMTIKTGTLLFAGFDRNDDYIIDRAEVSSGIDRAFKHADTDGTGVLSLVELEAWREKALGSIEATPHNFAFAPNFARTVSPEKFKQVLSKVADNLDKDVDGNMDGKIAMTDLLKSKALPSRSRESDGESCLSRIREERRKVEQQCRNSRGF